MKRLLASLMVLATSSALASEFGRSHANDNGRILAGNALKTFVIANIAAVQAKIGASRVVDVASLQCVSVDMRGDEAGTCIVSAISKTSSESTALYAILVGEADENGGILVREVEFLKQND